MVVIPVIQRPKIPKRFVKQKCIESELISVSFKVNTNVKFPEYVSRYYEEKIINNSLVYIEKEKLNPKASYGFQTLIEMDAEEYYKNSEGGRKIIDSYVIEKAKNTQQYNRCVQECIDREHSNREYNIESFIADFPEFNRREYESEAYYPEY